MLKNWLESQELRCEIKRFLSEHGEVWDIVVYGSIMRSKDDAKDIDFAIILAKKISVEEKLALSQTLKESIEKTQPSMQIDVKAVDLEDFTDSLFVARQGIMAEGYSLSRGQYLTELFGFETFALIKYSLNNLTYSEKKMLYYALKGRRGTKGVLAKINGTLVSRGLLRVPVQSYDKIARLLRMHKVNFSSEFMMSYAKRGQEELSFQKR